MIGIEDLKEKNILVAGLGKTGYSVCAFLRRNGICFDVVDNRAEPPCLKALQRLDPAIDVLQTFSHSLFLRYDILVVSPGLTLASPEFQTARQLGVEIIGDVELFARMVDAPVIAVTGSNGKSTVVAWLSAVLERSNLNSILCGNIGLPVLDALDEAAGVYILELSSFQLETTHSLKPLSAAVLNVSEDHMDRYSDIDAYARTKRRIFQGAALAVANANDMRTQPQLTDKAHSTTNTQALILFSADRPVSDRMGIVLSGDTPWLASATESVIPLKELPLPGAHNRDNALAIIALLSPLRLAPSIIRAGLKAFHGLPHRIQLIKVYKGVRWYNDSKGTNVDACSKAIEAMGAPVVLIAGGLSKDADFSQLRSVFAQHVKALVLIGRDANKLDRVLHDLAPSVHAGDMQDAVKMAASLAHPGDVVLLSPACASFDMFNGFEHRGDVFAEAVLEMAA